ncbi:MAG: hypothetical protein ABSG48_03055 [Geobacteraceae bacterium]
MSRNNKAKRDRKVVKKKDGPKTVKSVPFIANLDDTHCFQASIWMILKHFTPTKIYSWDVLDELTGKREGLWTWPQLAIIQMKRIGFDVICIDDFDYAQFGIRGDKYIRERYGDEVANAQKQHSDIPCEMDNAKLFLKEIEITSRVPEIHDMVDLLRNRYLIICNVNSCKLNGTVGYCGHFVVVYRIDGAYVYLHDPGLPPHKSDGVLGSDQVNHLKYHCYGP